QPRLSFRDVLSGDRLHDHFLAPAESTCDLDFISGFDLAVCLGCLAVDVDLAATTRLLRLASCLEEAADIEPHIQAHEGIFRLTASVRTKKFARGDGRGARSEVRGPRSEVRGRRLTTAVRRRGRFGRRP